MIFFADSAKKHGHMSVFLYFSETKMSISKIAAYPEDGSPGDLREKLYKRQILQGMKP